MESRYSVLHAQVLSCNPDPELNQSLIFKLHLVFPSTSEFLASDQLFEISVVLAWAFTGWNLFIVLYFISQCIPYTRMPLFEEEMAVMSKELNCVEGNEVSEHEEG